MLRHITTDGCDCGLHLSVRYHWLFASQGMRANPVRSICSSCMIPELGRTTAPLAVLIDSGQVRINGYVPETATRLPGHRNSMPVMLSVSLSEKGKPLLAPRQVQGKQTRLQLFALAYNLANFLRRLGTGRTRCYDGRRLTPGAVSGSTQMGNPSLRKR